MKRFFSTFLLLAAVASTLVVSNSFYKQDNSQFSAQNSNSIKKSIDLTEADVYQSKRNTVYVSFPN
ncbi:hypothetical protein SAMN05661096_00257 [Marivirga sericea]|uniref:Uncharacterized protein n=1 Tax=Marivirga sericea TaxID=1028 RepID=A0A1X7I6X1_9BACT|nr:hypothetical protein [Marivirga sericea]SMG09795.1 hypothetical protein SAMN05661096_00257 [Marivirga sericea]